MIKKSKKWKLLSEKDVSPSSWFPLFKQKVKLPNGKVVNDYYLSKMGDVVILIPINKNKEILFVKQYKHGAGEVIIELPAGRFKAKLSARKNALMELKEETGFKAKKLIPLGYLFGEPSKDTFKVFGFIATDLVGDGIQKPDETEDIQVLKIPISKLDDMISKGKIGSPDSIAFLKIAQLKYPKLFI